MKLLLSSNIEIRLKVCLFIFSLSVKLQDTSAYLSTPLNDLFCWTGNFRRKEPRKEEEAEGGEEEKGGQTRTMRRSTLGGEDPLWGGGAFPLFCPLSKLAKAESKLLKVYAKRHKTTTKTLHLNRVSQKNKHDLKK